MRKGGFGNMQQLMQQAKQMQKKMEAIQEKLGEERLEAQAGGGMVKVVVNGKSELVNITIDPEALEDVEMLQDMVKVAMNEALKASKELSDQKMGGAMGSLPVPPGLF